MDDKELDKRFDDFLKSRDLDKKIKDVVDDKMRDDKELEKFVVDITKNVLIQFYKTMWTRKSFWTSSIKNKST